MFQQLHTTVFIQAHDFIWFVEIIFTINKCNESFRAEKWWMEKLEYASFNLKSIVHLY